MSIFLYIYTYKHIMSYIFNSNFHNHELVQEWFILFELGLFIVEDKISLSLAYSLNKWTYLSFFSPQAQTVYSFTALVLLWSPRPTDKKWVETPFKYFRTQGFDPKSRLHPRWLSQIHASTASAVQNCLGTPFCCLNWDPVSLNLTRNHIKKMKTIPPCFERIRIELQIMAKLAIEITHNRGHYQFYAEQGTKWWAQLLLGLVLILSDNHPVGLQTTI